MGFLRKKKQTYQEAHNTAVQRYRQFSRVMIWVGIFNFIGPIIGIYQFQNGYGTRFQFQYCLASCDFLFSWLFNWLYPYDSTLWLLYLLIFLISGVFAALCIYVGVMASQGKKKFLKISLIGYMIDWLFLPLVYLFSGMSASEASSNVWICAGLHAIVTFCLFVAVYEYRKVLDVEKSYVKVENLEKGVGKPTEKE